MSTNSTGAKEEKEKEGIEDDEEGKYKLRKKDRKLGGTEGGS